MKKKISKADWKVRVDLAAMFRLTHMFGWDDTVWNHITARAPGTKHNFFMHEMGLLYEEVKASNLIHAHPPSALAATALKNGIPFLVQDSSMLYGKVGYHEWEGLSLNKDERKRIAKNLGNNKVLIMKNHGLLTVGETAGEAFMNMYEWPALLRRCDKADPSYKR